MIKKIKPFLSPSLALIFGLFIVYLIITFITPQTATSQNEFNISDNALFLIRLTITISYLIVWLSAFYCVKVLRLASKRGGNYAELSKWFSWGFLFLLIGAISTTLLSSIQSYLIIDSDKYVSLLTILINYIRAILPLLAFAFMFRGVSRISTDANRLGFGAILQSLITTLGIAVPYVWLIFTNVHRQIPYNIDTAATYYISDFLVITTIVIPILIGWVLGIAVAIKLQNKFIESSATHVRSLVNGLFFVIFSSMILQAILSLGSTRLYELGLGAILVLIYILIGTQALGFLLTARGAKSVSLMQVQ